LSNFGLIVDSAPSAGPPVSCWLHLYFRNTTSSIEAERATVKDGFDSVQWKNKVEELVETDQSGRCLGATDGNVAIVLPLTIPEK
jgi:hypothetical protein